MRAAVVAALCVCLQMGCFAQENMGTGSPPLNPQWTALRGEGVKAYERGAYAEALVSFQKSWPLAQTPVTRGLNSNDIASALHVLGRDTEARPWFERALEVWRSQPGREDDFARTSLGLADAERGIGDFSAAEQTVRSAMASRASREQLAALRNRLADMLREQGRVEEARELFSEALTLGRDVPKEQMFSLLGIAELDRETMQWAESIKFSNRALALAREQHDTESEALALRCLGLTHLNRGELPLSEPLLKRSLLLLEMDEREPPQQVANALQCTSSIHFEMHKYALAADELVRGMGYLKRSVGLEHPHSAVFMEQLAETLAAQKHYAEARQYADHAYAIMIANFGADSFAAAQALTTTGFIKQRTGDLQGAAADYESAIKVLRGSQSGGAQSLVLVMSRYSTVLRALHRKDEANGVDAQINTLRLR